MIKSILLHLSMNMWEDIGLDEVLKRHPKFPKACYNRVWSDKLRCDDGVWDRTVEAFAKAGGNMLIIDIGDGIRWKSHPEISVEGAWSVDKLKNKLAVCRSLGVEPIPKINFSGCHDAWMREYSRMLSTKPYYGFCRDVIAESAELFDNPRFLHIGMDEEGAGGQECYEYLTVRQGQLWWDDLNFYCDEVRKNGSRPWMWSDKLWSTSDDEYLKNVPLDVLQSNWYYGDDFELKKRSDESGADPELYICAKAYVRLDKMGYEQVPTGSIWSFPDNYTRTVDFCLKNLERKRLLGFMTAPWLTTTPENEEKLIESCEEVERVRHE